MLSSSETRRCPCDTNFVFSSLKLVILSCTVLDVGSYIGGNIGHMTMTSSLTNELVVRGLDCLGTTPLVTEPTGCDRYVTDRDEVVLSMSNGYNWNIYKLENNK